MDVDLQSLNREIKEKSALIETLLAEIGKSIIGQQEIIEKIIIGLLTRSHILIEGVPGLAKTYIVRTLASSVNATFKRIQFTPDLLPADITGTEIYNYQTGSFTPKKGPLFANFVLADEINRAPPKVQSALLEAMQERQVTIGDTSYPLPEPFMVLATQNPIEQEGTYPLPEAQVDRFKQKVIITYPNKEEEKRIMKQQTSEELPVTSPVIDIQELNELRSIVYRVHSDEKIRDYILDIVFATRQPSEYGLKDLGVYIRYGASPRASIYLFESARAHAFIERRGFVIPEDVKAMVFDILRHRIILSYEAEAEGITEEDIIREIVEAIEVP
ncbi:MAG: AAA family ATPase [candidate division WOR-3 bacterium]|nr:AAA family ATPase [candidate division WOR-3 bacterium]